MKIERNINMYRFIKYKMHRFPRLLELLEGIHSKMNDVREYNPTKLKIMKMLNNPPKIKEVTFETINRCNGECTFCPVNRHNDPRKYEIMSSLLFKKIIQDLQNIKYDGVISLFSNNEPLLDNRILEFIKYAKVQVPNARIVLLTNGKLLNVKNFPNFADQLDMLLIDNYYRGQCKLNKNIQEIYKLYADKYDNVTVSLRKEDEIMSSRGGFAKNRKYIPKITSPCIVPWEQFYIVPSGEVKRCCANPLDTHIPLGNVNTNSISEIWNGQEFQKYRKSMIFGRQNVESCRQCDVIPHIQ